MLVDLLDVLGYPGRLDYMVTCLVSHGSLFDLINLDISRSTLFFVFTLICMLWCTTPEGDPGPRLADLRATVGSTCVLCLGILYFGLLLKTFRSYNIGDGR